jgi:hypothetical protein
VCAFKDHFLPKIQGREVREKTSNYLEEVLASMKISYSTDFVESKLDVSAALNREADGLKLIEFLLRTPFESIKNSLQEEIMQYLHDRHSNGSMKHRDGFVWIGK